MRSDGFTGTVCVGDGEGATRNLTKPAGPASIGADGLDGDVAQLGERRNGIAEVEGSTPFVSTKNACFCG
jgi:hypothetical protein